MTIAYNPGINEAGGASNRLKIEGTIIYTGKAVPGASTSDPVWLITRLDTADGGEFPELHPNGRASFTNIWNDYASLNYS